MSGNHNQYNFGLDKTPANFVALTPLSFLARTAAIYPGHLSTIYEGRTFTWSETHTRCRRFASYLAGRGIGRGDTVAAMLPNVPAMNEAHFAVPMSGAVLNALNIRLDAPSIAFQLDHGGARLILVDPEFSGLIAEALTLLSGPKPAVIDVDDKAFAGGKRIGEIEYEEALAQGDPSFTVHMPEDEWDAIALSYTSGTTGNPKGVVIHHRGAYLNAVSNILASNLGQHPVYLWTLPMYHCNGWCFPWTLAAAAGVNVCLRKVDPAKIFELIPKHNVTHMCGAPIVYNTLINATNAPKAANARPVIGLIAGAAPPVAVLEGAERIGIKLTHVYGLTEVYGQCSFLRFSGISSVTYSAPMVSSFQTIAFMSIRSTTPKLGFLPDGNLNRYRLGIEPLADGIDGMLEIGAHLVNLVDEANSRNAVFIGLPPDCFRLRLYALHGVKYRDRAVEHAQRSLHLGGEVHVAGRIDNVDADVAPDAGGGSGRDGDAALLLLLHPVHGRSAFMDLADAVRASCIEQDALRRSGLTGIDVGHDADIPAAR